MCELLGMSANTPTDICFSFSGLSKRGGETGPHKDGFGICFYEDRGVRSFHDPLSSAHSKIAEFIKNYPIKSHIVISHIRRANRGKVCLENTHPFIRELWGRHWVFAHNGELKGIKKKSLTFYQPVGTTDSEYAFCWMLDQIRMTFKERPNPKKLERFIAERACELNQLGIFNFLLSDSRYLYAHCSTQLHWITRRAPFLPACLNDHDMTIDFEQHTTEKDVVTIIATAPLTTETSWTQMQPGEFKVFSLGESL